MADSWYFSQAGQTHGPFSAGQLKEQAVAGRLDRGDSVWKEGMQKGVMAIKVQHLFTGVPERTAAAVVAPALPVPPFDDEPANEPSADYCDFPLDAKLIPLEPEAAPEPPAPPPAPAKAPKEKSAPPAHSQEVRKRRVVRCTGAILMSQDGAVMRFKKKCIKCAHEDTSLSTLQIPTGSMRMSFFCPKCRKNHPVEIQGV